MNRLSTEISFMKLIVPALTCIIIFCSCNSAKKIDKNFLYFQTERDNIGVMPFKERVIQSSDLLSIQVVSRSLNQQEAALFNIPSAAVADNTSTSAGANNNGYIVGFDGNVELPILGSVKAAGLTRHQLQEILVTKLAPYIKDPSVTVRSLQFNVDVLGEVHSPGIKTFPIDKVTIIDAISASGDLTDFGKRKDVTVIRDDAGKKLYIQMDLTSGTVFQSPGYQLQPNDIVYVGANLQKLKNLNKGPNTGNTFRSVGTAVSVLLSLINLYYLRIK